MKDTDKLIQQTLNVFLTQGVKATNMDDVATSLGISKKTLYNHVDNKLDLVNQCFELHIQYVIDILYQSVNQSKNAIDELFLIDENITVIMKQTNPFVLGELRRYYPNTWRLFETFKTKELIQIFKDNLQNGIAQGFYRSDLNIDIISKLMLSRADVLINDEIFPLTTYNFHHLLMENKIYHIRGIATQKGINYLEKKVNDN